MRIILFLITFLLTTLLSAQIVDDSTKQVYGPTTTKFTFEENILNNVEKYFLVDTSLYDFEQKPYFTSEWSKYQDLGSIGTALFPVFYPSQDIIGRTSGFNAFRPYIRDARDIKYYDTKSPYLELFGFLGGGNRNLVDVNFSRNINENWNIGFDLRKITTDKQLARDSETDRQVVGSNFDIYTHYQNAKVPYQLLFSYSSFSQKVVEQGGVLYSSDSLLSDFFQYENVSLRLSEAQNELKHTQWHFYQDYQIAKQFQLYHTFDSKAENNIFFDYQGGAVGEYDQYEDFYSNFFLNADSTFEETNFRTVENEAGLKGDLANVFYRGYVKIRSVNQDFYARDSTGSSQSRSVDQLVEKYIGGYARFNWKDKFTVVASGEIEQGGEFKLLGKISSNILNVQYETKKYNVPYIYSIYESNHRNWSNDFNSVLVNKISGNLRLKYKNIELIPEASLTTYNNFVYFDENILPQQVASASLISSIGGHANLGFSNKKGETIHLENEVIATNVSGGAADQIRIPALFYNGKYFWDGLFFGDKVSAQLGFGVHARSSYFANAYTPDIRQFYLQNELEVYGYFKADAFISMRVDNVTVGLKWNYFNQAADEGFLATPYYPNQPKTIDLNIRWLFFD